MNSPLRRAPRRSSHLSLVGAEPIPSPLVEGFLMSDFAHKAGARIDYTLRQRPSGKDTRKMVVVPGFGGIKPVYGEFRDANAVAIDDHVASYRQPRTQKHKSMANRVDSLLHPDKLGKQAVVAMIDLMHEMFGQKVTLVGHSMGGPNAVEGALRRMEKVQDVVLLGSGGLEEGQNVHRLRRRMPAIAKQEGGSILSMPRDDAINIAGQALFHMARNPIRTLGEGLDIGNRDLMIDEINKLRAHGIGVHAVSLELDGFFPVEVAERDTRGLVDSFTVIEGVDHVAPQVHPEIVAEHISGVLAYQRPAFEIPTTYLQEA